MSIFAVIILILTACHDSNKKTKQGIKEKDMTYPVKNISVSINKPVDEVYLFASKPENFPAWIKFIGSMGKEKGNNGNIWSAETDLGNLKIEFVPKNNFGIIDHLVTLPDGSTVNNHMRVIANGNGSEFIFTLFWMPDRTEEEFMQDAKAVESDLRTLKKILENQ